MEISVDICFINKYNRYLVNRVERKIMSVEKTVTITTPQRQLSSAEAIAEFRKARKAAAARGDYSRNRIANAKEIV